MSALHRTVEVGGQVLSFKFRRSAKRRTVEISVGPGGDIVVTAPASASDERVWAVVRRRVAWIHRQRKAYEALPAAPQPRRWIAGETHLYLGRQYRLKLHKGPTPSVRLYGQFFEVSLPDPADASAVQRAMGRWYRRRAAALLVDRVKLARRSTSWLRAGPEPKVAVRAMRLRWGSTTKAGRVYFNSDLVKLPLGCVDYVVAHELAHLQVPHHGAKFWRLMSRCMPDWEKWKQRLETRAV